jgi:hypothetical protein
LSSAILYLAIVAIWAVVLVPRWLRPRSGAPQPVVADSSDADWGGPAVPEVNLGPEVNLARALAAAGGGPGAPEDHVVPGGDAHAGPAADSAAYAADSAAPADDAADGVPGDRSGDAGAADGAPDHTEAAGPPVARRAEVVKARRRLLTTLVTLTTIAMAFAVTRIDAYWIIIPPGVLLAGYLMLLRKFAHFDAERARRAARAHHAAAWSAAGQERASSPEPHPGAPGPAFGGGVLGADALDLAPGAAKPAPGAEIIDISGRITDQVYDQYADTSGRAVGD